MTANLYAAPTPSTFPGMNVAQVNTLLDARMAAMKPIAGRITQGDSLSCWGDSITAGIGATEETRRYVNLLLGKLGRNVLNNSGHSGAQVADIFQDIASGSAADAYKSEARTLMIGTNDANHWGAGHEDLFRKALRGWIVWAQRSPQYIFRADTPAFRYSGQWSKRSAYDCAMLGLNAGATASFTALGSVVYVLMIQLIGRRPLFAVDIAGARVFTGTLEDLPSTTQLGRAWSIACLRFDLGSSVAREVTVTALSTEPAGDVYVFGGGSNNPGREWKPKPLLVVGTIPPFANLNPVTLSYSDIVREVVEELAADGLNVRLADVHSAIGAADLGDNLHPNNQGMAKIADVFFQAITG